MKSCDKICPRLELIRRTGEEALAESNTTTEKLIARVQVGIGEISCAITTEPQCSMNRRNSENPDEPSPECETWAKERETTT